MESINEFDGSGDANGNGCEDGWDYVDAAFTDVWVNNDPCVGDYLGNGNGAGIIFSGAGYFDGCSHGGGDTNTAGWDDGTGGYKN